LALIFGGSAAGVVAIVAFTLDDASVQRILVVAGIGTLCTWIALVMATALAAWHSIVKLLVYRHPIGTPNPSKQADSKIYPR
jgi:hypothetical protein